MIYHKNRRETRLNMMESQRMIYLSDVSFDFPCPYCIHKFHKTVGWAESNDSVICPICGRDIHLDISELRDALQLARTALAKLRDGVKPEQTARQHPAGIGR